MMRWLDRHMGAVILVVTILLMGGMTYGATVDAPVKSALLKRADAEAGDYRVAVSLSKGSDKPIVYAPEGRSLLDVSAWESTVTINGTSHVLYRNSYNMVQEGDTIVLTWSNDDYALQEKITTDATGVTIAWSWLRHPRAGPQEVELDVGQFAYYMRNATMEDGVLRYRLDATDPRYGAPYLPVDPRDYDVTVRYDPPPAFAWFGETPDGLDGIHTRHRLAHPPAGENVPFFTQRLTYERTDAPAPPQGPLEVYAVPVLDPGEARVRATAGDYLMGIALHKGSDKPLLRASDGRAVLDLSAWDSMLRVDGNLTRLYRHEFNVTTDGTTALITWFGTGWRLEQEMTLTPAGLDVRWWWTGASRELVELHLAHFSAYMRDVTTNGTAIAFSLDARDPVLGLPESPPDPRDLQVTVAFDRVIPLLRLDSAPEGNRSFVASFPHHAEPGERALVAQERVSFVRDDAPRPLGPPVEARAAPVLDAEGARILLGAGGYLASLAQTKGSDQPLLRSDEGRALLEISGWESFLRVNEREMPLYRLDRRVNLSGDTPCIEWTDAQFILRECVAVSTSGMRVDWSWRRAEGAPAQEVALSVGHFAYFLEQAGRNERTLEYFLAPQDPREAPDAPGPRYHVVMHLDPPPLRSPFGPDAFRLEYELSDPAEGAWVPIFSESLRYQREASG